MPANNVDLVFPPAVQHAQRDRASARAYETRRVSGFPDRVTPELATFLTGQDTAFLATATKSGQPYLQHRGGPKGFIKVIDDRTLGFADFEGNRQYITLGNLSENDRAFLFVMDFAARQRVKLWGRARAVEDDGELVQRLFDRGYRARTRRAILFTIEAWDVNCSSHITARHSEPEISDLLSSQRARIVRLEAENTRLREALASGGSAPPTSDD
jgi:predicted pyridoxine 5'-phosphate oxidase superfamily flavin-nucleotide-binding protein